MAEGGFDNENPWLDDKLDHDGDDDDDDEEVDTTRPFQPDTASTLYHNGEAHEMSTLPHEQSGIPNISFDENFPLLEGFTHVDFLHMWMTSQNLLIEPRILLKENSQKLTLAS